MPGTRNEPGTPWASLQIPSRVFVRAVVLAIIGTIVEISSGVGCPPIPAGPMLLAGAATFVVIAHQQWTITGVEELRHHSYGDVE